MVTMLRLISWLLGILAIETVSAAFALAFVGSPFLPKLGAPTMTQPRHGFLTSGTATTTTTTTTTTRLWGSTNGDAASDVDDDDDDDMPVATRAGQHFHQAGVALQEAATAMGPTSTNAGPHLWHDVGDALIDVGDAWTLMNWEAVTYAAEEAAATLSALARYQVYTQTTPVVVQSYCSGMANEFRQISNIAGCSSIGPLTAVPNLIAVSTYLKEIAMFIEDDESNASLYPNGPVVGQSIRKASTSIEALVQCYA